MIILGLNAQHGDSSTCLFIDGKIINAIEEERIRRIKTLGWISLKSN
jgi:carbamoyltransferase